MHHPFSKILASNESDSPTEPKQTRRDALRTAVQVGAGVLVAGVAGNLASAQEPTTTAEIVGGEEGGGAAPVEPRPREDGEQDGTKLLQLAERALWQGRWEQAALHLGKVEQLPKPEGDEAGQYNRWQKARKEFDKTLKEKLSEKMAKAGKQAEEGKVVPALQAYRVLERVGDRYGLKQRAQASIARLAKAEGYAEALKKVKEMERMDMATPHHGGGTAAAARFEDGGGIRATTYRGGEEGGERGR